jgi:protein-L-isoaspartate(D-aspartate) O-methyltransferase
MVWLPPDKYIATLPKATVYGTFFVTDENDHPLQLRSARNPDLWQWPGGNMDADESPWECALREGLEETGLRLGTEPRLLAVHFLPPMGSWTTTHKIGFVFDGGRLSSAVFDARRTGVGRYIDALEQEHS